MTHIINKVWVRLIYAFSLALLICIPSSASAFSFLTDPALNNAGQSTNQWGRRLWNIPQNNNGAALTINWALAPAAQNLVFINPLTGQAEIDPNTGQPRTIQSRAFNANDAAAIGNAISTWGQAAQNPPQQFQPNTQAVQLNGGFDLESTALHEIGHALGLNHPNVGGGGTAVNQFRDNYAARNSGGPGAIGPGGDGTWGTIDDVVGQNVLFNLGLLGPIQGINSVGQTPVVEWPNLASALQGGRPTRQLPQGGATEAVMVQGAVVNESQRALAADDVAGLRAIQSGTDFTANTNDDFFFAFIQGQFGANVQLRFFNVGLQGLGIGQSRGLQAIGRGGPVDVLLESPILEQIGDQALGGVPLLAFAEIWPLSPGDPGGTIGGVDIFFDVAAHGVPGPSTLVLLGIGLAGLGVRHLRRGKLVG